MTMRLAAAELVDSREILPGQWLQAYHAPDLAVGSRAGQFVHIRTGDFSGMVLRRPFSLNTTDPATGIVTIHFRVIGRGTEWFTHLRVGDRIDLLGPLGRPFEVDPRSRHLLLIAGGLGIAGVRMLADEAVRAGRQVTLLFGAYAEAPWEGTLEIDPASTLVDLHLAILKAIGFDNDHLCEFYIARTPRSRSRVRFDAEDNEEIYETTLESLYPLEKGRKLHYLFDYGDHWLFRISKCRTGPRKPVKGTKYPRLVGMTGSKPVQYPSGGW